MELLLQSGTDVNVKDEVNGIHGYIISSTTTDNDYIDFDINITIDNILNYQTV